MTPCALTWGVCVRSLRYGGASYKLASPLATTSKFQKLSLPGLPTLMYISDCFDCLCVLYICDCVCICACICVCVCTCGCLQILSGAPHSWPLFHLGSCATYSEYLYSSSYSTRAVLRFFFLSPGFTRVEALEALQC